MPTNRLTPGMVLDGQYVIGEMIAEGGFAKVYRGHRRADGMPVAIKVLNPNDDEDAQQLIEEKFVLEATSSAEIEHNSVVTIYDFGVSGGRPFIVMELLDGHDLLRELRQNGPLPPERALRLLMPALEALAEAHERRIIHRDLKPANLFIVHPGQPDERIKVLDFGVARVRAIHATSVTGSGQLLGSPRYLAPEYLVRRIVTSTLDVYQMGLVMVEMLTGKPVVDAQNPFHCIWFHSNGELQVPDALMRGPLGPILMGALEHDYTQRFPDMGALWQALRHVDARQIQAPAPDDRARLEDYRGIVASAYVPGSQQFVEAFDPPTVRETVDADPIVDENAPVADATAPFDMRGHLAALQRTGSPPPGYEPTPEPEPEPVAPDIDHAETNEWSGRALQDMARGIRPPKPMAVSVTMPDPAKISMPASPTVVAPTQRPRPPATPPPGLRTAAPVPPKPAGGALRDPKPWLVTAIVVVGLLMFTSSLVCLMGAIVYNLGAKAPAPVPEEVLVNPPEATDAEPDSEPEAIVAEPDAPTPEPEVAPKAPEDDTIRVVFSTDPEGADLKEFDAALGTTPHTLRFAKGSKGTRRIHVTLKGYQETYVDVGPEDAPSMTIKLAKPGAKRKQGPGTKKGPKKGPKKGADKQILDKW